MTKEKKIEEMAKDLASSIVWQDLYDDEVTVDTRATSVKMRDKGYRKASDVAEDIIRMLQAGGINEWRYPIVADIKKKYIESENNNG